MVRWCLPLVLLVLGTGCIGIDPGQLTDQEVHFWQHPIVNGTKDYDHHAVGLLYLKGIPSCTATLIGERTVLTAAHCVTDTDSKHPPYEVIDPIAFSLGKSSPMVIASSVAIHPDYDDRVDLAVIRLKQAIEGVMPLRVASTQPKLKESVTLVGFGYTSDDNAGSFGVKRKAKNQIGKMTQQLITFFGAAGSMGNICFGDSGGPSVAFRGNKEVVVGVHSFGEGACGETEHDARTDVHYKWIEQQAAGDLFTGPANDSAPPRVRILSPCANSKLGPSFWVSVEALDDTGIARVELIVDGALRSLRGSGPCHFQLEEVPDGEHLVRVEAIDHAGRRASTTIRVEVGEGYSSPPPPEEAVLFQGGLEEEHVDLAGGCSVSSESTTPSLCLFILVLMLSGIRRER
jgi:V8-like Glu-specific endopeptidase